MSQASVHSEVHPKQGRARLVLAAWVAVLAVLLVVAYGIHQSANAAPVQPTWQQPVITIDNQPVVDVAQTWGAPFPIRYAARGADITVSVSELPDMAAGEATWTRDGDRLTSCSIVLEPAQAADVVAIAHEVGHCLGLPHDNGHEDSLMYWIQGGASGAAGVTHADRAALAALYSEVK